MWKFGPLGPSSREHHADNMTEHTPHVRGETSDPPLCVDLDGTLLLSDMLVESVFALLRANLLYLLLFPLWLWHGKAAFKQRVADRIEVDVSLLPYHPAVLEFLRTQNRSGRTLVLATATNQKYAAQIAKHLGLFSEIFASDARVNLSGMRKRECLVRVFGERAFDYIGNSRVDLDVWAHARKAVVVSRSHSLRKEVERTTPVQCCFDGPRLALRTALHAMRIHQWSKNLLLFVPLTMAHQLSDPALLFDTIVAFIAFGLFASSSYLLNDLVDLSSDRRHPFKRARPVAAGALPIANVLALVPALALLGLLLGLTLPIEFLGVLALYYLTTSAYSLWFRRLMLIDVMVLAGLYALRVIAGGVAVGVVLSFWLLVFSVFLFLSLALAKRFSELLLMASEPPGGDSGRAYRAGDSEGLAQCGISSGYLAVLVLAFYINSAQVTHLYHHPAMLWLLLPLMLFWITRVWLLARRGELSQDPVIFALTDRTSYYVGISGMFVLWLAT